MTHDNAKQRPAATVVLGLATIHISYLLLLPLVGLFALEGTGKIPLAITLGWIPSIIYMMILGKGYCLSRNPLAALLVVFAVPAQLAAVQLIWGGDLFEFLYESAVVEIATLNIGLVVAMVRFRPSGLGGALIIAASTCAIIPYATPLWRSLAHWPTGAKLLLLGSCCAAIWEYLRLFGVAAKRYNKTEEAQEVQIQHGTDDKFDFFIVGRPGVVSPAYKGIPLFAGVMAIGTAAYYFLR